MSEMKVTAYPSALVNVAFTLKTGGHHTPDEIGSQLDGVFGGRPSGIC